MAPVFIEHRKRSGLNQLDFAALVGVSNNTIGYIEHGKADMAASMLFKWCEALGPDFTNDIVALLFEACRRGIRHERDKHLESARRLEGEALALKAPVFSDESEKKRTPARI